VKVFSKTKNPCLERGVTARIWEEERLDQIVTVGKGKVFL